VELGEIAVAREQLCKHHATAGYCGSRDNAIIKEPFENISVGPMQRLYKKSQLGL
jgi:hypothetical protein